jgi:hypothetical protein
MGHLGENPAKTTTLTLGQILSPEEGIARLEEFAAAHIPAEMPDAKPPSFTADEPFDPAIAFIT